MKINFLLLAIIIATISSCSTSYKTGQTPDDVYYSPARFEYDSVRTERRDDNTVYENSEDREIRRRVYNRRNRRYDDRYDDRYNNPYGYNYPYGGTYPPVYGNPKYGTPSNTTQPRKTNLGAYSPTTKPDSSNASNSKFGKVNNTTAPTRTFGNNNNSSSNNGSGIGNFIKRVFTNSGISNTNSSSNNSSPSRTFETKSTTNSSSTPANSKSSTTESKTGGSAPVRKF